MREEEPFLAHVPGIQYGVLDTLAGYAVRRVQIQAYEDFMTSMAAWHITPPRFSAMTIIALNPGLKLTQLAKVLGIARSGAVMLVDALEDLGYVRREPMPEDKRAFSLVMTDKGRTDLGNITAAVQAHDARITASLNARERDTFWRLLRKMTGMTGITEGA
ncbi:MarR family transcriptional regulator [Aquabacterium sp.]|uniref:MarR family winged helix-turn-helix transcriptional regulator n=1 Tax=Aquabacterium sp. TaxID=1872578 RepID=UPI0025C05BC5|nr:MarR family transcriptional regulator [Aquabacterium sp.]